MDSDKIEKTIEIILNNQAQFYAGLEELKETQKEAEKRGNTLERVCLNLYNATVEQGNQIAENANQIAEMRGSQKETDKRLNAVIYMAEKFFSGNNGDSDKK